MADVTLTQKPVVPIDPTTQFTATKVVNNERIVVQIDADDLRGLDGVSAIASITDVTPAPIPALGQAVQYGVDGSAGLVVGQVVAIGAAASLTVLGMPTPTSIVLENVDATPGAVATGAKIVPSGRPGINGANSTVPGPAGANAFTTVTTAFTIPALNATGAVVLGSTAFLSVGNTVAVGGYYLKITAIANATQLTLRNERTGQSGTIAGGTKVAIAGEPGPAGAGGASSVPVGSIYYQWATSTAASDPTDGFIKANNASVDLATTIYISETDIETSNRAALLSQITAGGILRIQKVADGAYVDFTVATNTDDGAWRSIAVAFSAGSNTPTLSLLANDPVVLAWLPAVSAPESGGATGIQYTYINTAGTPGTGQIRSANISFVGASTVSISATDAQVSARSTADVLARLKTGTIIEIAASQTNKIRGAITTDYAPGTNSFNWADQIVSGVIANNATVFLNIISDAPSVSSGGGIQGGTISATAGSTTATINEATPPSGASWPVYTYQWFMANSTGFDSSSPNLVAGATANTLTLSGLSTGTQYFIRRLIRSAANEYAATPEISFTTTGANPSVIALINALTAQGYTPTAGEQTAINNFFAAIGANNAAGTATLQSAFARFRGFLGNAFNPCKLDWIDPANTAKHLTLSAGTINYTAAGIVAAAANSGLREDYQIPASLLNDFGFGLYFSAAPVANVRYMGSFSLGTNASNQIQTGNASFFVDTITGNAGTAMSVNAGTYSKGFHAMARISSTSAYLDLGGAVTSFTNSSLSDAAFYDTTASQMTIGAVRRSDGAHLGASGTSIGCSFILNKGVPQADMASIRAAIAALMTALGRD